MNTPAAHQTSLSDVTQLHDWLQQHRDGQLTVELQLQGAIKDPISSYTRDRLVESSLRMSTLDRFAIKRYLAKIKTRFPDIVLPSQHCTGFQSVNRQAGYTSPIRRAATVTLDVQAEVFANITSMHTLERLLTQCLPQRLILEPCLHLEWRSSSARPIRVHRQSFWLPSHYDARP